MDLVLQELKYQNNINDIGRLKISLEKILAESAQIELIACDIFELLLHNKDEDVLLLSLQCIAELSKQEKNRKIFTTEKIITSLINVITTQNKKLVFHCSRALGNVCYENDDARSVVGVSGVGILIYKISDVVNIWICKDDPHLMTVLCGCLLNILTSCDTLQKITLKNNILSVITIILNKVLPYFEEQQDCITYALQILSFATDHMIDQWLDEELCRLLVQILQLSENPEISILCLEILRQQSENDDHKFLLAKLGTCELVYELVQKYGNQVDDEDSRAALKLACDLIVLILTGDEAMKFLYDNSNGKVYHQMVSWIDSSDSDLMTTGILAIGNFARSDAHCINMVESGLSRKLIDVLAKHNTTDVDTKIQHAILSALRHLSIPMQNKARLIEENIVETLYGMINIDYFPVIFKLMGTFRMLIDKQETTAYTLANRKEFIEKIVYWCYNSDHLGVRAEAPRLLVWLIKNSQSTDAFPKILSVPNSVKCLVEMVSSLHVVMQHEALLALNLMCSHYFCTNDNEVHPAISEQVNNMNLDDSSAVAIDTFMAELLIAADIYKNISFLINKYHEKMSFDTARNIVTLLSVLSKSTSIVDHFRSCNINSALHLLQKNKHAKDLNNEISSLINIFKDNKN